MGLLPFTAVRRLTLKKKYNFAASNLLLLRLGTMSTLVDTRYVPLM